MTLPGRPFLGLGPALLCLSLAFACGQKKKNAAEENPAPASTGGPSQFQDTSSIRIAPASPAPVPQAHSQSEARGLNLPGRIAFWRLGQLWVMNADGSNQRQILRFPTGDNGYGKISWAPDGKRLAFARKGLLTVNYPDGGTGNVPIYDVFYTHLDSANWFFGLSDEFGSSFPDWSPDGSFVVYARDMNRATAAANLAQYQPNYQLVVEQVKNYTTRTLQMPKSTQTPLQAIQPAIAPDGRRVAFSVVISSPQGGGEVVGIATDDLRGIKKSGDALLSEARRTPGGYGPAWSPDGKQLAFIVTQGATQGLCLMAPDGTNQRLLVEKSDRISINSFPPAWSPDGRWLAFSTADSSIYVVNVQSRETKRLTGPHDDLHPAWSKK